MTVRPPVAPVRPPRARRWGVVAAVAAILVAVGYLAFSSVSSALVYYVTPGELLDRGDAAVGETVRLGGLVKVGSISGPDTDLRFVVTDGEHEVAVHTRAAPTSSFREGVGAVVEGRLAADGTFEADRVIVKHDENYEAPPPGEVPSDRLYAPDEDG